MGVKLSLLLALMLLLPNFHCVNWQGSGVMPYDMQNTVWNYINTNFDPSISISDIFQCSPALANFVTGLSNQMNSRFDPAWNMV